MSDKEKRPNWGGVRPGAGRPPGTFSDNRRKHLTVRVARYTWEKLHKQADKLGLSKGRVIDLWSKEKKKSRRPAPTS